MQIDQDLVYKNNLIMKKYLLLVGLFLSSQMYAQTGIGTTTPDASAKLDVSSTNKGFLPPRVTLTGISDNSTIASPATGLLVYNTGTNVGLAAGYYYWNGNAWATIATAGGSGSFAASFLRGSRSAAQTGLTNGGTVIFTQVDNTAGQEMSLNTSTGQITLAAGRTYRLIAQVPNYQTSSGDARLQLAWYNETSGAYIGSTSNAYPPGSGASYGATAGMSETIITTTTTTVISYRIVQLSSATQLGGSSDFPAAGSYPWFEAQVISGNAPVTGQSVDYIQASLSTNQALSAAGNIIFNTSSGTGITITSGGFNLIANKTYKLEAAIGGTSGGYAYYAWVDNSNNLLPGGSIGAVMKAGTVYTDAPQDKAVVYFTPTVDTRVFLRVYNLSGTLTAYAPSLSTNYTSTWASIQQVGSSAFVNPWTLSGTSTYNTTGNVGIGTNNPTSLLNIAGGGVRIASGMSNTSTRPSVNTSTIGNYEIRGVGGGTSQNDGQDDGFLRLSAGGGTNAIQQSSIDLSGYSATVSDMNSNIVMRTAGTERLRIDNSGNVNITGKLNVSDAGGGVAVKAAGFVDAGIFVTLDNLKATVTTSGNRGLSLATVTGTLNLYVQGVYTNQAGAANTSYTNLPVAYTTTASGSLFGWSFGEAGNTIIYHLTDATNSRLYRVTLPILSISSKIMTGLEVFTLRKLCMIRPGIAPI